MRIVYTSEEFREALTHNSSPIHIAANIVIEGNHSVNYNQGMILGNNFTITVVNV